MNEHLFSGFYTDGLLTVSDTEQLILEMRNIVTKRACASYQKLVAKQVERIVDEIALNQIPRPDKCSILDYACNIVQEKIVFSGNRMAETEYCLYAGLQIMTLKIGGEPRILFKMIAPNDIYSKSISKIKELIPFDIYSNDIVKGGSREKEWQQLCEKYSNDVPFVSNLLDYNTLKLDLADLKFRDPADRVEAHAVEKVMNRLLSYYSCGKEIAPNKLMEYILASSDRIKYGTLKEAVEFEKETLKKILPNITLVMVTKNPLIKENNAFEQLPEADVNAEEIPENMEDSE